MLKVFQINGVPYGSTAKIMVGIADCARKNGIEVFTATGYSGHPITPLKKFNKYNWRIGGFFSKAFHIVMGRITGQSERFSFFATRKLIKRIKKENPDIIHLHILHSWYINVPMLFRYIKKNNVKVIWTMHDCWALTGHCANFDMVGCDKWKTECKKCPQYRDYPKSLFDNSKFMHKNKKKWFLGVKDLTIVTPSNWLAGIVKQSFLKDYPVKVINNGIDLTVFKPTESNFREKYNLKDKFILLGVAFGWGKRKGLDIFIELSKRLSEEYQIVLVGTDDNTDKLLPDNIISIHRTQNQTELAEIYTAADLFVNPTREDNYPTVNMEALACGTPVITFNTGGSPECIDEKCGMVVEKNDIDGLEKEIYSFKESFQSFSYCIARARTFNEAEKYLEYIKLYEGII